MTQDDIIRMAHEAGFADDKGVVHPAYQLEAFANLVAAAEREACAKVCDDYDVAEDVNSCDTAEGIALAIRMRGD
jgi:hypothetical protein